MDSALRTDVAAMQTAQAEVASLLADVDKHPALRADVALMLADLDNPALRAAEAAMQAQVASMLADLDNPALRADEAAMQAQVTSMLADLDNPALRAGEAAMQAQVASMLADLDKHPTFRADVASMQAQVASILADLDKPSVTEAQRLLAESFRVLERFDDERRASVVATVETARRAFEGAQKATATAIVNVTRKILPNPELQERSKALQRARQGDVGAISSLLRDDPFEVLDDRQIVSHIQNLAKDRRAHTALLERVADAFRQGLLQRRPGRPPRWEDRDVMRETAKVTQELYEHASIALRTTYRSEAERQPDVDRLAEYIASHFPEALHRRIRRGAAVVLAEVTPKGNTKNWGKGFGTALVADAFGYSPRYIRALLKKSP